jgi:hypothetical protein
MATRESQKGAEVVAGAAEEQAAAAAEAQRSVEQQSAALEQSHQTSQIEYNAASLLSHCYGTKASIFSFDFTGHEPLG